MAQSRAILLLSLGLSVSLAASVGAQEPTIGELEAHAEELLKARAYSSPSGENVVDVCKAIIQRDPTNARAAELLTKVTDIYVRGGERRLDNGDFKGALANFNQALMLDSGNRKAKSGRDRAKDGLERSRFQVEPNQTVEYYLAKGNELFDGGDFARASKYYEAILKKIPDDPFAKLRAQACAKELGVATAATPASPDPEVRLSYYREAAAQLEKSGQWEPALSYYKQIVAAEPDDAEAAAGLLRAEDHVMGYGRLLVTLASDPFRWSAKVKTPNDAQQDLAIRVTVSVDGKEAASLTDTIIEKLALGDVSTNELVLPPGFSVRVPKPGNNQIVVQIIAGTKKPRVFGGQATLPVPVGTPLAVAVTGTSTLSYGGTFVKKTDGDYKITLEPAAAPPAAEPTEEPAPE